MARTYGEIPGFPIGSSFKNRTELAQTPLHRPLMNGIWGGKDGAESIVVSGGYVDDEDYGDEIIYTGEGGNNPNTKRQVADQELTRGNAGLVRSQLDGNPIRVIRGAGGDPACSPASGLRYEGLFRVVDHWHKVGRDGYRIWQFRLVRIDSLDPPPQDEASEGDQPSERVITTISRIVRNTVIATGVKYLHKHRCQVCAECLMTPAGPYAEAAHIRGLGKPHNGPDVPGNILCLCPNHHVLFDVGAIYIDEDYIIRESGSDKELGTLRTIHEHEIDPKQLKYHRDYYS
jgi:putative restriction endonuclease